ncbi:hypothetical protein J8641_11665 [Neisseria elongata subsp. nitroreducens]|uniref:Uncharacterized protein n=1 Tax=Neisseria elongata subsp. nitroreducens TaxID=90367 RepID=A0A9X0ZY14_NEIEL|nr:hypothetical protein [Neisseria elongata]MBS9341441.1 hypothetical protein [Neisseria elongata subsp. nitroreducens]
MKLTFSGSLFQTASRPAPSFFSSQAESSTFSPTPSDTVMPKAATAGVVLMASSRKEMAVVRAARRMPPSLAAGFPLGMD